MSACVETAITVVTGLVSGLIAKIGLKYALKWKVAAKLVGKINKLVTGIVDVARNWGKVQKGVTDSRRALKTAKANARAAIGAGLRSAGSAVARGSAGALRGGGRQIGEAARSAGRNLKNERVLFDRKEVGQLLTLHKALMKSKPGRGVYPRYVADNVRNHGPEIIGTGAVGGVVGSLTSSDPAIGVINMFGGVLGGAWA